MPRRPGGRLTEADLALWRTVTEGVTPLRPEKPALPAPEAAPEPPPLAPGAGEPADTALIEAAAAPKPPPGPPPLAPLDRRLRQRLARGAVAVEGRIDLHGLTQAEAHRRLAAFLESAQVRGLRLVLVITGKGGGDEEASWFGTRDGRGVLRRLVPQWLGLPEFRRFVVGFEPAQRTHGGEGALYVKVRRRRAGPRRE